MAGPIDTLIIGGGISGLSCARRLGDARRDFLLVTDRLGGRMHHSPGGSMNFGATYVTADCRRVSRYVGRGLPVRLHEVHCLNHGEATTLFHWPNLAFARPAARLIRRLRELRATLHAFRKEAEYTPQKELRPSYPLIDRYARQPAGELIEELHLGPLHDHYFKLAFQATCFIDPLEANALFYLAVLFPVIVRTWVADFTNTYDLLTAGYREKIRIDRVTALTRDGQGLWEIRTAADQVHLASNVVIAAPYHNARQLYAVPRPHRCTAVMVLHVRGRRKPPFAGRRFVLVPANRTGVILVWRQRSGVDQVFSLCREPDLAGIYEASEVLDSVSWNTAIVVSGADWAPLVLEPNLYLAGDYNLCGLEDAFITGLCAANQIIREQPPRRKSYERFQVRLHRDRLGGRRTVHRRPA